MDWDPYLGDSAAVIAAIVRAYRLTYAINVRRFDPRAGDDGHTFGVQNWRNGIKHLAQEFGAMPGVRIDRPNNHLRIRLPTGVVLRPYRAHFEGDELAFFPASKARAQLFDRNAISFYEYSTSFGEGMLPVNELVIQHDGTVEEGLRAIYLSAPFDIDKPATGFFLSECIYVRDTSVVDDFDIDAGAERPGPTPFTDLKAPDVVVFPEETPEGESEANPGNDLVE